MATTILISSIKRQRVGAASLPQQPQVSRSIPSDDNQAKNSSGDEPSRSVCLIALRLLGMDRLWRQAVLSNRGRSINAIRIAAGYTRTTTTTATRPNEMIVELCKRGNCDVQQESMVGVWSVRVVPAAVPPLWKTPSTLGSAIGHGWEPGIAFPFSRKLSKCSNFDALSTDRKMGRVGGG